VLGKNLAAEAQTVHLFPYAEFVKFDSPVKESDLLRIALDLLRKHLASKPAFNPIAAFQNAIRERAHYLAQREPIYFHKYAFNTLRQLGANFELLSDHLAWLTGLGEPGLETAMLACKTISSGAKSFQFQLARAAARKKFEGLANQLEPLIIQYQIALDDLTSRYYP
jgi:hypothetical protein